MPSTPKSSGPRVYQFKVTIENTRPPIWRRLRVPGNVTFLILHDILQDAFGWTDSHLHEFIIDGVRYGDAWNYEELNYEDVEPAFKCFDESHCILERVIRRAKKRFRYTYDFGDNWEHEVLVEKIEKAGPDDRKPVCVTGRRCCPPEDCGGPPGYARFLEAIRNPEHQEHDEYLEWVGGKFDPEAFDIQAVNRALAAGRVNRDHGVDWVQ